MKIDKSKLNARATYRLYPWPVQEKHGAKPKDLTFPARITPKRVYVNGYAFDRVTGGRVIGHSNGHAIRLIEAVASDGSVVFSDKERQ